MVFCNREWENLLMKIVSPQVVTLQVTKTIMWIVQAFFIGNLILEIRHLTSIISGSYTISAGGIQLTAAQLFNKFPTFVTPECSLPFSLDPTPPQSSQTNCITSYFLMPILVLPSYAHLWLPRHLFPSDAPTKNLYAFILSLMCATCPAHLILPDVTNSKNYQALNYAVLSI